MRRERRRARHRRLEEGVRSEPDEPSAIDIPGTTRRTAMTALVAMAAPFLQGAHIDDRGGADPASGQQKGRREDAGPSDAPSDSKYEQANAVGFRQIGTDYLQTLQSKLERVVDVDDFRLPTDADDTAAFTRAIASLVATGGEIRTNPRKRYAISASITIASVHHIAISGANFGLQYDASGPGIAITKPMASLFRVVAPASRGEHGGVSLRNLSFYDATGGGGTPGKNAITWALLDLRDASSSLIENCQFHFISGSVIRADYFVQSSIIGCRIRYCGAPGKKVLHLGGTDTAYASQSVTVHDTRIEVCYGDAYLFVESFCQAVTISACTFEAGTVEYPQSSAPFLDLNGTEYKVIGCALNRNLAQAMILRGRGIVTACSFETGPASTESILIPGARNIIASNTFTDTRRAFSVRVTGVLNLLTGNRFFASGGIVFEGANNQFHNNVIDNPSMSEGGYCLMLADYCAANGNHLNGYDFAESRYKPSTHGVALNGAHAAFVNNTCRGWVGKTFIRVESSTAMFQPNIHDGVGTFMTTGVALNTIASTARVVLPANVRVVTVTGTAAIAEIVSGVQWAGMAVTLVFASVVTVSKTVNVRLTRPFTSKIGDTLTVVSDGVRWYEAARSVG